MGLDGVSGARAFDAFYKFDRCVRRASRSLKANVGVSQRLRRVRLIRQALKQFLLVHFIGLADGVIDGEKQHDQLVGRTVGAGLSVSRDECNCRRSGRRSGSLGRARLSHATSATGTDEK